MYQISYIKDIRIDGIERNKSSSCLRYKSIKLDIMDHDENQLKKRYFVPYQSVIIKIKEI